LKIQETKEKNIHFALSYLKLKPLFCWFYKK